MSESAPQVPPRARSETHAWLWIVGLLVLFILFLLFRIPPADTNAATGRLNARMHSKEIAVALFIYARNHNGTYPEGNSSTEICQKLLDEEYIEKPATFYVPMPGKQRPEPNQKVLKPENVSFDLTVPPDARAADHLPLVFLTGYRISYTPGSAATPVTKPHPSYGESSWLPEAQINGIVVAYNDTKSKYLPWESDFTIANFIPPDFKAEGQTYRQLTPDGSL